ncbi:hypothetical protein SAMN04487970_1005176 [Paenibacillus tianmuensis]|uniref:YrhK-like protein n=1 Tax=Paenibacillus tianmuensis TaxID=624147 RepID=A0A1G4Q7L9_9BACL|nr:hypothetical protein [Paenibacillus tianmuensis]SCW40129.1 hypothetical protein SAMN04487970_1005176 [Paenibacillus tianmuensis]
MDFKVKDQERVTGKISLRNDNKTALTIQGLGAFIIIAGVLYGIFNNNIWVFAFPSIVSGIVLIGFSEIIRLLHEINERQKNQSN